MTNKELKLKVILVIITIILQFIMKNDYCLLFMYVLYSYAIVSILIDKVQFSFKYVIGLAIVAFIYVVGASMFSGYVLLDLIIKGICPTLVSYINSHTEKNLTWLERENLAYEKYLELYNQGYIKEELSRIDFHIMRRSSKDVLAQNQRVRE